MADETVAQNQQNVAPAEAAPPTAPVPETDAWRRRAEEAERELALRRELQSVDWFDSEEAFRELAPRMERNAAGDWVVTGRGAPSTVAEAARELASRKPHWVRARVFGGTGAGSGTPSGVAHAVTYAELLRPENAAKMKEFLHERPEELERLREAHFER